MRILQVASEVALIAKVGGLGDVLTGVSRELLQQGVKPLIFLPRYGCISYDHLHATGEKEFFTGSFGGESYSAYVEFFLLQNEIPVALLDTIENKWQSREDIYGKEDDVASFIQFTKASFDWLAATTRRFDIVHAHDWQAAYLVSLLRYAWKNSFEAPKTVLTLHNLEYQGKCSFETLSLGCPSLLQLCPEGLFQDPWSSCANLLKAAILSSDCLVAVSNTYAKEIVTPEGGKGLDGVLNSRKDVLHGILNGVDTVYWNPGDDPFIPEKYSCQKGVKAIFRAKREAKKELFETLALDEAFLEAPFIGAVTRLVHQKGLQFIRHVLENLNQFGVTGVLLGSTYDEALRKKFHEFDQSLLHARRGRVLLQTNEALAHLIYAASDFFLVPSLFEPCGLTQMIALHYGAIPIVRKTGGLADTIVDCEENESGNGFVFVHPDLNEFTTTVSRALSFYHSKKESWNRLVLAGMQQDVGWSSPAKHYIKVYSALL